MTPCVLARLSVDPCSDVPAGVQRGVCHITRRSPCEKGAEHLLRSGVKVAGGTGEEEGWDGTGEGVGCGAPFDGTGDARSPRWNSGVALPANLRGERIPAEERGPGRGRGQAGDPLGGVAQATAKGGPFIWLRGLEEVGLAGA